MSWPVVKLGEVAELNPTGPKGSEIPLDTELAFVPMAAVSETGTMDATERRPFSEVRKGFTAFRDEDVLVAKITPCYENNKIAKATIATSYGFGSTEFHVLRCADNVLDPDYLTYFLRQDHVRTSGERRMTGSGGQRRVPKAFLNDLEIPLPPLAEQKRIAAILDQAARLTRLRTEALARLDTLGQAIFHEMFGGDASWPTVKVADITMNARTGPFGSQLLVSEFTESGIPVLGIDNVVQNKFVWAKERYISPEKYRQLQRYQVCPGDVLVTIMGTCGRCAVVPDTIGMAINTKHICCMTPDTQKVRPRFLQSALIWSTEVLAQLGVASKGAIMPGLNMGKIANLDLPLPPLERQVAFERRLERTDIQRNLAAQAVDSSQTLFASLQHRAFRGEL